MHNIKQMRLPLSNLNQIHATVLRTDLQNPPFSNHDPVLFNLHTDFFEFAQYYPFPKHHLHCIRHISIPSRFGIERYSVRVKGSISTRAYRIHRLEHGICTSVNVSAMPSKTALQMTLLPTRTSLTVSSYTSSFSSCSNSRSIHGVTNVFVYSAFSYLVAKLLPSI